MVSIVIRIIDGSTGDASSPDYVLPRDLQFHQHGTVLSVIYMQTVCLQDDNYAATLLLPYFVSLPSSNCSSVCCIGYTLVSRFSVLKSFSFAGGDSVYLVTVTLHVCKFNSPRLQVVLINSLNWIPVALNWIPEADRATQLRFAQLDLSRSHLDSRSSSCHSTSFCF